MQLAGHRSWGNPPMHDELLEWCSERGEGTVDAFEAAAEWLAERKPGQDHDRDPGLATFQLQALGHLEVDWRGGRWAVAPTSITVLDDAGGNALLLGSRPRSLMRRLRTLHVDPDDELREEISPDVMVRDPVPQFGRNGPSAIYLTAPDDSTIERLCEKLGIRFEQRIERRLRAALPSLVSYVAAGLAHATPPGFAARRLFPTSRRRWRDVEDDSAPGAYEYRGYGPAQYFYRGEAGSLAQADKWIVVHAELRRLGLTVMQYSGSRRSLFVPGALPLPLLYGRCAVFRTGLLPRVHTQPPKGLENCPWTTWLEYENVTAKLATTLSERLGHPLGTSVQ